MAPNEAFGWVWIVAGVLSGLGLGMGFHRDGWLGGYASFPRRMLRLGHISFLGLGFVNLLFALSVPRLHLPAGPLTLASWSVLVGAVTMPICCALMAWRRGFYSAFAVPVLTTLAGAALAAWGHIRP